MTKSYKNVIGSLFVAWALGWLSPSSQAQSIEQCVRQTAKCAGSAVEVQLSILSGAANAIAFTAQHPHCVADIVTGNYVTIGISGAMVALNIKDPYGSSARPLVEQLNKGLPFLPIVGLLTQYGDDALGVAFQAAAQAIPIPSAGAPNLDIQLGCGSAIAVQGAQLIEDVKKVAGSVKKLGQSCGAAASCFAGVLKDIITDPGGAVASAVDWAGDKIDDGLDTVLGGCKNQSATAYMATHILPRVNPIAHATVWGNLNYGTESGNLYTACFNHYENCDSEAKDAHRRCRAIIAGDGEAQGSAYNKDKGLHQRVGRRQLELGIPKMLALEHQSVMAQNYSARDAAIKKRQLDDLLPEVRERLGVQVVALGNPARSAELKKILGIEKASSDGKFGADQTVALSGIGQAMLAMANAETPKSGVSWSFRFGEMYKQFVPNREYLLKVIDEELEARLVAQKKAAFDANGNKWNLQIMLERHQKMNKEAQDHPCKYFDDCKEKVKLTLQNYGDMVIKAGSKSNYAGLGALGVEHADYKNYLTTRGFLEASFAQHLTLAKLAFDKLPADKKLALTTGQITAANSGMPANAGMNAAAAAAPPPPLIQANTPPRLLGQAGSTGPVGMPSTPGMQAAAQVPALPRPVAVAGMPAAPGMQAVVPRTVTPAIAPPIAPTVAPPPPAIVVNTPAGEAVKGVVASAPAQTPPSVIPPQSPAAPTPPPVVVVPTPPPVVVAIVQSQPPPPPFNFDDASYRSSRQGALIKLWTDRCKDKIQCVNTVRVGVNAWIQAEIDELEKAKSMILVVALTPKVQSEQAAKFEPQLNEVIKNAFVVAQPAPPTGTASPVKNIPKQLKL